MSRFPAHIDAPPPPEFTVEKFKDGRPITFRLVRGQYQHRLGADGAFVSTGCTTYPAAAAHARRLHGVPTIGSRNF